MLPQPPPIATPAAPRAAEAGRAFAVGELGPPPALLRRRALEGGRGELPACEVPPPEGAERPLLLLLLPQASPGFSKGE